MSIHPAPIITSAAHAAEAFFTAGPGIALAVGLLLIAFAASLAYRKEAL